MDNLNFYLSAAIGFANQASTVFNMFLTVMFSSFGFAAALPLRDVGKSRNLFNFSVSSSSILVGFSLSAFYIISFFSFYEFANNAENLIATIYTQGTEMKLSKEALAAFELPFRGTFGVGLPSFGFIIGALVGIFTFMWLTNVKRSGK